MNLTYQAIDPNGRPVKDFVEATSTREALDMLRSRGLMVTEIREASQHEERKVQVASAKGKDSLPLKQLMIFTRQMSMLLSSGSAVVPALDVISQQMKHPDHARLIKQIHQEVEEGGTLTETLQQYPRIFDPIYCSLVSAGEAGGQMPEMFSRLADMIGRRRAIKNKIVGAMAYPALLTVLSMGILSVLFLFVMPRFREMFDNLGVPLPPTTAALMFISNLLASYWYIPTFILTMSITGLILLFRTETGRQLAADAQIKIPVIGILMKRLILARILRVMGMLTESHVGLLESIDLARDVSRNKQYRSLLDRIEDSVMSGKALTGAMDSPDLIPPTIAQAIRIGEESGKLGGSILFSADVLEQDNTELIDATTRLIEPLILIVMGVIVGTVAISLFLPLFDMTTAVQQ